MYKTKYALLHQSRTYTNVFICIRCVCMYKGHLNRTASIKAVVPQSVELQTTNLKVVGSRYTVDKNFSCCNLSLSTRVHVSSTAPIQMKFSMTFIRYNSCI